MTKFLKNLSVVIIKTLLIFALLPDRSWSHGQRDDLQIRSWSDEGFFTGRGDMKRTYGVDTPPFFYAIESGDHSEVQRLIIQGTHISSVDNLGQTALHWAGMLGSTDIITALIKEGADIEAKDNVGYTALHVSVLYNQLQSLTTLIEAKANIEAKDHLGRTWSAGVWLEFF